MQGATEYAKLFNTGQRGRLFFVVGSHARGETFHIWVLPTGVELSAGQMPWTVSDAVEVYGIVSGQPGWTEVYGWLHRGRWENDFADLVVKRRDEVETTLAQQAHSTALAVDAQRDRVARLLSSY